MRRSTTQPPDQQLGPYQERHQRGGGNPYRACGDHCRDEEQHRSDPHDRGGTGERRNSHPLGRSRSRWGVATKHEARRASNQRKWTNHVDDRTKRLLRLRKRWRRFRNVGFQIDDPSNPDMEGTVQIAPLESRKYGPVIHVLSGSGRETSLGQGVLAKGENDGSRTWKIGIDSGQHNHSVIGALGRLYSSLDSKSIRAGLCLCVDFRRLPDDDDRGQTVVRQPLGVVSQVDPLLDLKNALRIVDPVEVAKLPRPEIIKGYPDLPVVVRITSCTRGSIGIRSRRR